MKKIVQQLDMEFVSYEQALVLKELGFEEPCIKYWDGIGEYFDQKDWFNWNQSEKFISIPLYQQAFRWFRNKHNIFASVDVNYCYKVYFNDEFFEESNTYNSYKEAELECLKKLIEIVNKEINKYYNETYGDNK